MLQPLFYFFIGLYFYDCPVGAYHLEPQHIPIYAQILNITPREQMVSVGGKDSLEQTSFWAQVKIKNPYYSDFKEGQLVEMETKDICKSIDEYDADGVYFFCKKNAGSSYMMEPAWFDYEESPQQDTLFMALEAYHQWLFAEPQRTGLHTYNCNENCRLEAFFDKGQLHGKYTVYNRYDDVLLEGQFAKGKPSGVWILFRKEWWYLTGEKDTTLKPAWNCYKYHTKTNKINLKKAQINRFTINEH